MASSIPREAYDVLQQLVPDAQKRVEMCAGRGSVGKSARPPVEAQVGRHRDSVLTDFAGINGGFDHRSTILAPHRHAART
jgi:hypothetical protein